MPGPRKDKVEKFIPGDVTSEQSPEHTTANLMINGEFRPRHMQPRRQHGGIALIANPETGQAERDPRGYRGTPGFVDLNPQPTALERLTDPARLADATRTVLSIFPRTTTSMHGGEIPRPTPGSAPQSVPAPQVEVFTRQNPATQNRLAELLTAVDRGEVSSVQALDFARNSGADPAALQQFLDGLRMIEGMRR